MSIESIRRTAGYRQLEVQVELAKQMPHDSVGDFKFGRNEMGTLYFSQGAVTVGLCSGDQEPLIYAVGLSTEDGGFVVTEIEIWGRLGEKRGVVVPKEAEVKIYKNVPEDKIKAFFGLLDYYRQNDAVADRVRWNG